MGTATALVELNVLRMDNSQVSGECIVSAECFLFRTDGTVNLLLTGVVDRVFVPGEIVRPGKDGVAWLSGRRVDSFALVRPRLGISLRR